MIPSMNLVQLFSALPHEQSESSSNEGIKYLQASHHGQPAVGSELNKPFHTAAVTTERPLWPLSQVQGEKLLCPIIPQSPKPTHLDGAAPTGTEVFTHRNCT